MLAFLDTETTGLNAGYNEVLQIRIVDGASCVLMDTLISPTRVKQWPEAHAIYGIAPADVVDAPTLDAVQEPN